MPCWIEGDLWSVYPCIQSESPPQDAWCKVQSLNALLYNLFDVEPTLNPASVVSSNSIDLLTQLDPLRKMIDLCDQGVSLSHTLMCHRDLRVDNVMWHNGMPHAIDFEYYGMRPYAVDQCALSLDWSQPWPVFEDMRQLKQAQGALLSEWLHWFESLFYVAEQDKGLARYAHRQWSQTRAVLPKFSVG